MGNSDEGSREGAVYQEMMDCQSRAVYRAKRVSLHCSTAVTANSVHNPFLKAACARFLRIGEARRA
jgi:hypothetical protein